MASTYTAVKNCIYRNPGIHFNAIGRQLDIATGQTQYHVRRLANEQTIETEAICGRTHYYPPTFSDWERGAIALLRRETTREIVLLLLNHDEMRPDEIATQLGFARSTIEWHLSRLVEYDVATKHQPSDCAHGSVVVQLQTQTEVYRLLREIEPRLIDRLVDRFASLTDELLDE